MNNQLRLRKRLKYLFSLGRNEYPLTHWAHKYYPGFFDTISAFITKMFPEKYEIETLNIVRSIFSISAIFGISRLSRELFNKEIGKIVFVLCFFNPIFFGHMAINPKDTIIVFANVWFAEKTNKIWINSFDKKINEIKNLHNKLINFKNFDIDENTYEDDLPKFLKSISSEQLENLLNNITNNLVDFKDSLIKFYTVHSYKGLEDDNIRLANDININEDINIYYVAITRSKKKILIDL